MNSLTSFLVQARSTYADPDYEWQRLVMDHRRIIMTKSNIKYLTINETDMYKFRPAEYLKSINVDPNILWVVLWLNQIPNEEYFIGVTQLIVPQISYLNSLRQLYRAIRRDLRISAI